MTAVSKQTLYDYFCSGGSATHSISTIESESEDLIDTFFGTWTTYQDTSTIVGWSSRTEDVIEYKDDGNMVFVHYRLYGTSNSTVTSFTLPSAEGVGGTPLTTCLIIDNGSKGIGYFQLSSKTVTFADSTLNLNAWTNSGSKGVYGQFFYEKA